MPLSSIFWGPGYQNVLTFGYPLYDRLSDREEREGSEHKVGISGTEDSWITGRDYTLMISAKFIPESPVIGGMSSSPVIPGGGNARTGWSAGMGYQDFLDYHRQGLPFRFVPDATNPGFYIDQCFLVDPKSPGPGSLGEDLNRVVPFKIRNASVDFSRALRGILFEYTPGGGLPAGWTFSRAGLAYYFNAAGKLQTAQANVLRENDPPDEPTFLGVTALIEAAATNLVENNGYETDVVGTLGNHATTVQDNNPLGTSALEGTHCCRCDITNIANAGFFLETRAGTRFPVTVGGFYVGSHRVFVPAGSGLIGQNVDVGIEWYNGAGTLLSTSSSSQAVKAGWNCYWSGAIAPANAVTAIPHWYTIGAPGAAFSVWTELNQFERQDVIQAPSSPILSSTVGGTTRAVDTISLVYTGVPLVGWIYRKWIERGIGGSNIPTLKWMISPSNSNGHFWRGFRANPGGQYVAQHQAASGTTVSSGSIAGGTYGDLVEAVYGIYADGSIDLRVRINGGADSYTGRTAALLGGLQDKWGDAANTTVLLVVSGGNVPTLDDEELITFKYGAGAPPASVAAAAAA